METKGEDDTKSKEAKEGTCYDQEVHQQRIKAGNKGVTNRKMAGKTVSGGAKLLAGNTTSNHIVLKLVLVFVSIITSQGAAVAQDDFGQCSVQRCGKGPTIRFPFHIRTYRDKQELQPHDSCAFPGFQLSCNTSDIPYAYPELEFKYQVNTSLPGLHLSFSVKAKVISIDYRLRQLNFYSTANQIIQTYASSSAPAAAATETALSVFKSFTLTQSQYGLLDVDIPYYYESRCNDITFYNCSANTYGGYLYYGIRRIDSLSNYNFEVYSVDSHYTTSQDLLTSCTKLYNISDVPFSVGSLTWSGPDCEDCEANGQYCKLKPNSTTITHCFPIPKGRLSKKLLAVGKVGGIIFLVLIILALCYAIYWYKQHRNYQLKIETFLEDYIALKPTRYSYADIKKISNRFKFKLGQGGYGSVFKGQISTDVVVAIKVLNDTADSKGSGEDFINEVGTIGLIHHVNVVRLVGYCADGCRRALVYEFLPNNSLEKFVYSKENRKKFLGWEKMQEIVLGIAKGIEYLHQGCAQRILHFDIKPHNILLDQNFNPKISDFGLAKLCMKGQSIVSMTMARGTIGYIAPEVFSRNFGKVSSKSDVYSFGMLLLEMVGAKDNTPARAENTSEVYFPEWIFHQLEQGKELRSEMEEVDSNIARKLTVVGLWCVNWHPADRPSMKNVIQMIQAEDCPAIPPNPFSSTSSSNASAKAHVRPFTNELEVISESE